MKKNIFVIFFLCLLIGKLSAENNSWKLESSVEYMYLSGKYYFRDTVREFENGNQKAATVVMTRQGSEDIRQKFFAIQMNIKKDIMKNVSVGLGYGIYAPVSDITLEWFSPSVIGFTGIRDFPYYSYNSINIGQYDDIYLTKKFSTWLIPFSLCTDYFKSITNKIGLGVGFTVSEEVVINNTETKIKGFKKQISGDYQVNDEVGSKEQETFVTVVPGIDANIKCMYKIWENVSIGLSYRYGYMRRITNISETRNMYNLDTDYYGVKDPLTIKNGFKFNKEIYGYGLNFNLNF